MRKIQVYQPNKIPEEPPLFFQLVPYQDGVDLVLVNEAGVRMTSGKILRVTHNGTIERYFSVGKEHGLPLDANGAVVVER
jgi:hypothetical protein